MKRVAAEKSSDLPTTLWDKNFYDLMTESSYSVTPKKRKRKTGRLSSTSRNCYVLFFFPLKHVNFYKWMFCSVLWEENTK